jgi:hypothetical protein
MTRLVFAFLAGFILCAGLAADAVALGGGGGGGGGGSRGGSGARVVVEPGFTAPDPFADASAGAEEELESDSRDVVLPVVVAPLSQDGRLTGYAFINTRVRIREGVDHWDVRYKLHFVLDELIRAVHEESISLSDGSAPDPERVEEVFTATLGEVYGRDIIGTFDIISSDLRLIPR